MLEQEFSTDFTLDDFPALENATILGICKHNRVRRMIIHHKSHR